MALVRCMEPVQVEHLAGFQATGLIKVCPRCGRHGAVLLVEGYFAVVWDGPARNPWRHKQDVDTGISVGLLVGPDFGCGYCPAAATTEASA